MYQASENLYQVSLHFHMVNNKLFDKVLVIDEGRCIFFGTRPRAKPYFEELGFECPPRQTTADFLTAVTDPYARVITQGFANKVPRTAEEFERCFQASLDAKSNFDSIASFENEIRSKLAEKMDERNARGSRRSGRVYIVFLQASPSMYDTTVSSLVGR